MFKIVSMSDSSQVVEIINFSLHIYIKKPLWFLQSYPFIIMHYYLTVKPKV